MAYRRSGSGGGSLHDPDLLKAALAGYEHERTVILDKIAEIQQQLGGREAAASGTNGAAPTRGQMSAAGRKRIADAQRKRWAAFHKEQTPAKAKKTVGVQASPKRSLSAAARKRISEATKKRWAAFRAKKAAPGAKTGGA